MARAPSFCVQIKNETAHLSLAHSCCLKAELAAFARILGSIRIGSGGAGHDAALLFTVESPVVARRIFKLARKLGWTASIMMRFCTRPRRRHLFLVQLPLLQQSLSLLQELGLTDRRGRLKDRLEARLLDRNCCRRAYLRGCFLGGGFLSRPGSSYHLEFVLDNQEAAGELAAVLSLFGLASSCRLRKGSYVVYLKEADQVGEFLRLIGATQGALAFENGRIIKEMRNRVNRLVNCETANVGKAVEAGLRQVELISRIKRLSGLNVLEPPLRQLAELRIVHPEASLVELGRLLEPPLGKSGVNHRFRQLRLIAEQLAQARTKPLRRGRPVKRRKVEPKLESRKKGAPVEF